MPAESARTNSAGYTVGAMVDESVKTAMRAVEAADATVRGAVERGVDTAYMVIEEYMLRGRQAAGRNHERRNGRHDMNEDRKYGGGYGSGGYATGPWNTINPLMAPWLQMMRLWTDSMNTFMPGGAGMATDWMNQFMPGAAGWNGVRPSVSIHLTSESPVEVSASVDAGVESATLTVEPLAPSSGRGPSIVSVSAHCTPGRIRLVVEIPPGQPAGHYSGSILDSTGTKRGVVQLDVEAQRGGSTRTSAPKRARKSARKSKRAASK